MSKRKFDAVLFDVDGTVLDTAEYIFQAYKYTLNLHLKKKVTWEDVAPVLGLPLRECYQLLTALDEVDHLMECHHQFQCRNLQLATAYPNTLKTLKSLAKEGVSIAAVTSRYSDQLLETLKFAGVDKFFKAIITPMEVKKPKPNPESIFKALKALGIKPERAVFIGDSLVDINAGKAAGVRIIGALYGFHGQRLLETKPDYLVDDIGQIVPIILGYKAEEV